MNLAESLMIISNRRTPSHPFLIKILTQVKKSYLEAPENEAIREYYEVVDKYNVSLVKDLAKRFKNSDDPLHRLAGL